MHLDIPTGGPATIGGASSMIGGAASTGADRTCTEE